MRRHHKPQLHLPGYRPEPASRPVQPLTLDRILDAAGRIADDEGLEALSMRRLGAELGAGATSLYWHVRNKEELLDLLVDRVIGEILANVQPAVGWRDEMAEAARATRRVLLRHRTVAVLLGSRPTFGPNALAALEWMIGRLRVAGFDELTAALGANTVTNWAAGYAVFESRDPLGPSASDEEREVFAKAVVDRFEGLDAAAFPNVRAMVPLINSLSPDEQFERGLAWILDGLAGELGRSRANRKASAGG
jgi:TetR/AcrR family tetracycline transcriptional repressor